MITRILLLFLHITLLANDKLYLEAPLKAQASKEYHFKIIAIGNKVKFKDIDEINNKLVHIISSNKTVIFINGKKEFKHKRVYALIPTKTFTIPAIKVNIDNKLYYTKPKQIKVLLPQKTKSDRFELTISANKHNVYVGEQINYKVIFKYRNDVKIADLEFVSAEFNDFWSKTLDDNTKIYKKDGYNYQELYFLLFAQKSGQLTIKPSKINLTITNQYDENSIFNTPDEQVTIFSNKLNFNVKPLPNNIKLIGDFKISTFIDKKQIHKAQAVNFKVVISGFGNIDDIPKIKLNIDNTTIYTNPAKKDFFVKNGLYGGVYTKTFSIIAQNDFIIPPITFKYFDLKNKISKQVTTNSYYIKVIKDNNTTLSQSKKDKSTPNIQKHNPNQISKKSYNSKYLLNDKLLYFSIGFVCAMTLIIFIILLKKLKQNNITNSNDIKSLKKASSKKELLNLVLPYINKNPELDKLIIILEQLIYSQNENIDIKFKQLKKEIIKSINTLKQGEKTDVQKDPFYNNDF